MEKPNYKLVLSLEADQDLERIYIDGYVRWGQAQADKYYDGLIDHFGLLAKNPMIFRAVSEVREGYRRGVYRKHAIYYRIDGDTVKIMAIVKHENRP